MPAKSGYAPVNGVEVWYQMTGQGDPIVLLHGGFMSGDSFAALSAPLAEKHTVIAIDLQGHGHTLPFDRPMTFENMVDDIAGLIKYLGYDKADVLGYSLGGGVALQLGIRHPEVIDRLILMSTPFAYAGWHDYNQQGMKQIGAASAPGMMQTPLYQMYAAIATDPEENWIKLNDQLGKLLNTDYDWSAAVPKIPVPVMLVVGDWDAVRTAHTAQFFELLGGGQQDAQWDGSGMNRNRLAVLPGATHYNIAMSPMLPGVVAGFIDGK